MFWMSLAEHGDRPALILADGTALSHAALAARADAAAGAARALLAPDVTRPLVLLECANTEASITAYIACLRAGWPVIPVAEGGAAKDERIRDTFRPNLIFRAGTDTGAISGGGGWEAADPEPAPAHPDLAVLLSTSGTTGAAKLVRLSRRNIAANAASIAEYLGLTSRDRAMTTLPFHYSYGMSVLHTQLLAGGALVLSEASVTDDAFWEQAREAEATSLALVPFQFELLESSGFAERRPPSLRYVTQAGGKLSKALVERFLAHGRAMGFDLFVMYGQTEASPRISYVPPKALPTHLETIGIPVPGGRLWIADEDGGEITEADTPGELVYEGPNVMLGYAEARADLAAPGGAEVLRTGDIAARDADGFFRVVGRQSRFLKLVGLRIGLDEVERALGAEGLRPYAVGDDTRMTVYLAGADEAAAGQARMELIRRYGLTQKLVAVRPLAEVPLLSSGKIDYRTLNARAKEDNARDEVAARHAAEAEDPAELETVIRDALRRDRIDLSRGFAEHGGDSLSYLEVRMALSRRLGHVPEHWEKMPLRELMAIEPRARGRTEAVPIDIVGRVVAILAVIALHTARYPTLGGAYLLIALIGYSLARFQLVPLTEGRVGQVLRVMLVPILVGYYALLIATQLLLRPIGAEWFLLLGNYAREFDSGIEVLWFVGLYAQLMLLICLPFLFRPVRALMAARPFEIGIVLLLVLAGLAGLLRADLDPNFRVRDPFFAGQLVLLGWLTYLAGDDLRRRLLVSVLIVAEIALFWTLRLSVIVLLAGGLLPLLWFRTVRLPWQLGQALTFVAQRTLYIYLVHSACIMVLVRILPARDFVFFVATVASSLVLAVIGKAVYDRGERLLRGWIGSGRKRGTGSEITAR